MTVLQTYPSKSSLKQHEVRRGADGVLYCTCWPWKKTRWCKHLESYVTEHGVDVIEKVIDKDFGVQKVALDPTWIV